MAHMNPVILSESGAFAAAAEGPRISLLSLLVLALYLQDFFPKPDRFA
jgi:hypothetical protein